MPNTPILAIPQVAENQAGKEITINDAILALESAMGKGLSINFASTLAVTLSVPQITRNYLIKIEGATAATTLTVPDAVAGVATARTLAISNLSAWDCTVKSSSALADHQVLVPSMQTCIVLADGPVIRLIAKSVPNGELRDMTDVDWATIGNGKVMIWNASLNKFQFITPLAEGSGVPSGGANGQVLTKVAGLPVWAAVPAPDIAEVPDGGVFGQVLTKTTDGVYDWADLPDGLAIPDFLVLTDTPSSYAGQSGKLLAVNDDEDGVEFIDAPVSLPPGGSEGQVLQRAAGGAAVWDDAPESLPAGGSEGQVLTRDNGGDAVWLDPTGGGGVSLPAGGTSGQFLAKVTNTDGDAAWVDAPSGGGGGTSLSELDDVDVTTSAPTGGQALVWDEEEDKWVPGVVTGGGVTAGGAYRGPWGVPHKLVTYNFEDGTIPTAFTLSGSPPVVVTTTVPDTVGGYTKAIKLEKGQWFTFPADFVTAPYQKFKARVNVSTEGSWDLFEVKRAGAVINTLSGVREIWEVVDVTVAAGAVTVGCYFTNYDSGGRGRDNIWISEITIPVVDPDGSYAYGDVVTYSGDTWLCILSGTTATPGVDFGWTRLNGGEILTQAAATYTAVLADAGDYIRFTSSVPVTFTIPAATTAAFPINTEIEIEQAGTGAVTIVGAAGVTINAPRASLTTAAQFSTAILKKVSTNVWTLKGDMA